MESHTLYVTVGDASRGATLTLLHFIKDNLHTIKNELNVTVKVHAIRANDMQNPLLLKALQAKGITHMPALLTARGAHMGAQSIMDKYNQDVQATHRARQSAPKAREQEALSPDDIDGYLQREVSADDDDEEDEMGESAQMMSEYHSRNREIADQPRSPLQPRAQVPPRSQGQPRAVRGEAARAVRGEAAKKTPGGMRTDNLQMTPTRDQQPRALPRQSPPSPDDDGDEGDDGGSAKDEQMLRALRANSEHSLPESDDDDSYRGLD